MRAVASWLDTIGRVCQAIPDLATPEQVQSARVPGRGDRPRRDARDREPDGAGTTLAAIFPVVVDA
jgi:hypothetical protein